jgi:hypothetical protein
MKESDLKQFLNNIKVPESVDKTGFLEIIGKQSNENIISKLYAHFINDSSPEVRGLFVDSLIGLIKDKFNKSIVLSDPFARAEVAVGNGRIDLLITDQQEQSIIIIENKIYHFLNNNLLEYWKYKSKNKRSNKVGVLLTLKPHAIPQNALSKFINITHAEWIGRIKTGVESLSISTKSKIYLNDFINTIENISKSYSMDKQAEFYFQNAEKILKVEETIHAAHAFLNNQLQLVADRLGWSLWGSEMEWKNFWDKENKLDTYFSISLDEILNGKLKFKIFIELCDADIEKGDKLKEKLKDEPKFMEMIKDCSPQNGYWHLAYKEYSISFEDFKTFSDVVVKHIMTDFADIMIKSIKHLYKNKGKNTTEWEKIWKEEMKKLKDNKS